MNVAIILAVAVAALWALSIFFGIIGGFSKTFTHTPTVIDSSAVQTQAQQSIEDTQEKQQKMMDDMKQKMEDEQSQKF